MKEFIFSKKLTKHSYYTFVLLVLQWIAIFLLAVAAKPFYIVTIVPVLIGVVLYLSRESKLLLALSCVSLYLGYVALFQEMPKTASFNKCFEFNISYPGTDKYEKCVKSLTTSDYAAEIFKF